MCLVHGVSSGFSVRVFIRSVFLGIIGLWCIKVGKSAVKELLKHTSSKVSLLQSLHSYLTILPNKWTRLNTIIWKTRGELPNVLTRFSFPLFPISPTINFLTHDYVSHTFVFASWFRHAQAPVSSGCTVKLQSTRLSLCDSIDTAE